MIYFLDVKILSFVYSVILGIWIGGLDNYVKLKEVTSFL